MAIHIRRYEYSDQEAVCRLHRHALAAAGADAGEGPWDDDLKDIRRVYLENRGEFLVAVADGALVGMGALRAVTADCGDIKRMRVESTHQRSGIGTSILMALEDRALTLDRRLRFRDIPSNSTLPLAGGSDAVAAGEGNTKNRSRSDEFTHNPSPLDSSRPSQGRVVDMKRREEYFLYLRLRASARDKPICGPLLSQA